MQTISSNDFLESLHRCGLYDSAYLSKVLASYTGTTENPRRLAAYLVKNNILTRFQARSLLERRYKGLVLGQYHIQSKIGQGGMGVVYQAKHCKLNRLVAIKVLPQDKMGNPAAVERFYREARAAALLDHPNIVKVHDVCEADGLHFLVMEYIHGTNLQKFLDSKGPIQWKTAVNIALQVCRGLEHAHERNLVHGDIKPGNILVDKSGQVKILDLGLAHLLDDPAHYPDGHAENREVLGSIDYISPEQALGHPQIDTRSDIYSLGATLYALVMGKPPVEGPTPQKLLEHQMKTPQPLHVVNSSVPRAVSEIISKMLAKQPEDRYATPAELIAALSQHAVAGNGKEASLGGTQFSPPVAGPAVRRPATPAPSAPVAPTAEPAFAERQPVARRPTPSPRRPIPPRRSNSPARVILLTAAIAIPVTALIILAIYLFVRG